MVSVIDLRVCAFLSYLSTYLVVVELVGARQEHPPVVDVAVRGDLPAALLVLGENLLRAVDWADRYVSE